MSFYAFTCKVAVRQHSLGAIAPLFRPEYLPRDAGLPALLNLIPAELVLLIGCADQSQSMYNKLGCFVL